MPSSTTHHTALHSHLRRQLVLTGAALGTSLLVRPAFALSGELQKTINTFTSSSPIQIGRVNLEIAPIVDNGNTVPITITVDSPMRIEQHVTVIALFNERNPQREVIQCLLGPHNGRASISTRIRLATTQQLVALARMNDGSWWSHSVDVIVAIAACIEDEG